MVNLSTEKPSIFSRGAQRLSLTTFFFSSLSVEQQQPRLDGHMGMAVSSPVPHMEPVHIKDHGGGQLQH